MSVYLLLILLVFRHLGGVTSPYPSGRIGVLDKNEKFADNNETLPDNNTAFTNHNAALADKNAALADDRAASLATQNH